MLNFCKTFRRPLFATLMVTTALCLSAPVALAQAGFSIAVDGEHVAGDYRPPVEPRKTDVDLATADIQVRYDGLDSERRLAAGLLRGQALADGGVSLVFGLDSNYGAWIERSEIRIFEEGATAPLAVVPVTDGEAVWAGSALAVDHLNYIARIYGRDGRYDETRLAGVSLRELRAAGSVGPYNIYGGDDTGLRSIPVYGGTISVNGSAIPPGSQVRVMGQAVPVDSAGRFVIDRILPPGDHVVDIAVVQPGGAAVTFRRDVNIPTSEWFYVGLADLTVGTRWGEGALVDARPEEFGDVYYKGRAAFYLKGKIKGEYLLTASGDTGEGPLSDLFGGALSTDPQAVLRRIDPNEYYPVYGDDSVLEDDAPTRGKLYVRLERGASHVLWGNFRTEIGDASMLRTQRSLYGASGHFESDALTAGGDARVKATAYAAQPGTVPARDVLRGTGGSAYVLRRQDIVPGSEIVTIETVNAVTGSVISSRTLRPGLDYSINYLQGLVILAAPLSSTAPSTGAVQSSQPDYTNVAVQYEFTPTDYDSQDYALGASGSVWLGDHVRIGGVAMSETDERGEDLTIIGANARVEATSSTFIEAEVLRSQGQGRADWLSVDGGFTYIQQPQGIAVDEAYAYRLHAQADLADFIANSFKAVASVTLEGRQQGFSTLGQQTLSDTFLASANLDMAISSNADLALQLDHIENAAGLRRTEIGAELQYRLSDDLSVTAGLVHRDTYAPGGRVTENGSRTDLGLRISYAALEMLRLDAFGQVSAQVTPGYERNDRVGLGADWQINEQWSVYAEGSVGSTGPQALAMLSHSPAPGERSYVGLRVAPDASDDFFTQSHAIDGLIAGTERKLNEAVSVHAENTYGLFSDSGRLNALYGINFTPDAVWSASATYEAGRIADDVAGTMERSALSAMLAYDNDGLEWTTRGELRLEDSADNSKDRNTFLGQTGLSVQTQDDWRILAGASALLSRSDQASILDGDYIEATIGGAYRPVDNDRLNMLIRYTYLYDLPGPDQVSHNGSTLGPAQRSHIFSVDANYDLTENLTIGGKYGFRIGEVSDTRDLDDFVLSSAHLFVLRADLGIVTDWHLLLEGRGLYQPETQIFNPGALAMVSYDFNDSVRLGVGYNFGNYSDDLRDLSLDDHGAFLNLSSRF